MREIVEFEHAVQISVYHAPALQFLQTRLDMLFCKFCRRHEFPLLRTYAWEARFRHQFSSILKGCQALALDFLVFLVENF